MPFPQTLEAKPKCIFFTDFDGAVRSIQERGIKLAVADQRAGTITLHDSNDWLVDAAPVSLQPIPLMLPSDGQSRLWRGPSSAGQ